MINNHTQLSKEPGPVQGMFRAHDLSRQQFVQLQSESALWGIGLTETVSGHTLFLHDGRARNLTEAILWHGGEAETAKAGFANLPKSQRDDLLAFLESL